MNDQHLLSSDEVINKLSGSNHGAAPPFDLNIMPQRSHDIQEMYIQDNGLKLFDPVTDDPTPEHMAARTSSEYVNTDEEDEVE